MHWNMIGILLLAVVFAVPLSVVWQIIVLILSAIALGTGEVLPRP